VHIAETYKLTLKEKFLSSGRSEVVPLFQHMFNLVFSLFDLIFELVVLIAILAGMTFEVRENHEFEILFLFELILEARD
jgi:hypothetical protein